MTGSEVYPGLWVGDSGDADFFPGERINVREGECSHKPKCLHIPVFDLRTGHARMGQLEVIAAIVDGALRAGKKVMVHCLEGNERSPLAAMWFLHRRKGMTLDEAWSVVSLARAQAKDRREWLIAEAFTVK